MDYKWFLFSFKGRITPFRYGCALFASVICCLVFMSILAWAVAAMFGAGVKSVDISPTDIFGIPPSPPFGASFDNAGPASTTVSLLFYATATPVFAVSMWVLAATSIKRLHDRDRSGWWMVAFLVVPALLGSLGGRLDESYAADILKLIAFVLNIWGLVELIFRRGTIGPNRFGPDPLAPIDTRPHWEQQSEIEMVPHKAGPPPVWYVKRSA